MKGERSSPPHSHRRSLTKPSFKFQLYRQGSKCLTRHLSLSRYRRWLLQVSSVTLTSQLPSLKPRTPSTTKLSSIKSGLSSKSQAEVKKVFEILDQDKSGYIEEDELKTSVLAPENSPISETKNFLSAGDSDGDGKIGVEEFQALVKA
ncbi:unnamed protein product [Ranitomeya imitator]|uniref:Parvalbumin n=1 Tax=Ranitomeya imitator TaxID=111125 RepID=A0ABN9MNR7_9NEOB|nr:unnamed protein product [Ranitomeya imitator]